VIVITPAGRCARSHALDFVFRACWRNSALAETGDEGFHMLVKAAERILLDIAKHRDVTLPLDLNARIRPEKRGHVHQRLNKTYNFLKHADRDFDDEVPVHDLPRLNAILLLVVIHHYITLLQETTSHMTLHISFMYAAIPGVFIIPKTNRPAFEEAMSGIADMTPGQFFSTVDTVKALFAPQFDEEKARDTADGHDYYDTPFAELDKSK
jgi:hypothetical protein